MSKNIGKWHDLQDGGRAGRWLGNDDVRSYRPPKGWQAEADLIEYHPATGEFLGESQWWIFLRRN